MKRWYKGMKAQKSYKNVLKLLAIIRFSEQPWQVNIT